MIEKICTDCGSHNHLHLTCDRDYKYFYRCSDCARKYVHALACGIVDDIERRKSECETSETTNE